ncbi:MAG TPA: radical SAM protein [Thermoanaerobaculia bacterium]|nr:radical SAM protein [Thermoanaerobaculia bacterium]
MAGRLRFLADLLSARLPGRLLGQSSHRNGRFPDVSPLPNVLSVEISSHCNLHCVMCALTTRTTPSSQAPGHIAPEVWRRVLEVAPSAGHLNINGWGENFANPRFLAMIEEVDAAGVSHNFSTNGSLVAPPAAARLARLANLRVVNVSLDATDAQAYRNVRGGDVRSALRGLSTLLEALGPERVTASFVVNEASVDALPSASSVMASLGARHLVLQAEVDSGRHETTPERAAQAVGTFLRDAQERGLDVLVVPFLQHRLEKTRPRIWQVGAAGPPERVSGAGKGTTRQCSSPWEHVFVDKDGRVFPCCNCPPWTVNGDTVMGDLRHQSFAEVWNGARFRQFRRQLLDGPPPPVCQRCEVTSWGVHLFKSYAARILKIGYDDAARRVRLTVRNCGLEAWSASAPLRLGTTRPRDRESVFRDDSWLAPSRPCQASKAVVAPGARARLDFTLAPGAEGRQLFQLLLEGLIWLPETELAVDSAAGEVRVARVPSPTLPRQREPSTIQ